MDAGETIRQARRHQQWSRQDLARHLGVSVATVTRWELNTSAITTRRLDEVVAATGLTTRVLLEEPVDHVGAELEQLAGATFAERLRPEDLRESRRWIAADAVVAGSVAARLQGVPVRSQELVILVGPGGMDAFEVACFRWARRIPPWEEQSPPDERFFDRVDRRRLVVREVPTLPRTVTVRLPDGDLQVVPLSAISSRDVDPALIARVLPG